MKEEHYFAERESKLLELKSTLPKFDALIKTCIAFANGVGGQIVIGVDDESRKIIGIDDELRKRIYDDFPNSLYDSTNPSLLAQIYEKNYNERSVLIIEIPQSYKKPCFVKKEGIPKGVYLRVGSHTKRASQEYIEELMRESHRISFDEQPIHQPIEILSQDLLTSLYGKNITKRRLISDKVISQSAANAEMYFPTVAGVIHFCETPHAYIPEAVIICTQFKGISGREIIQTQEVFGNLAQQAEVSLKLVTSWITRNFTLRGVRLTGKTVIPEIALREAILNALIHRKYFIPGAVKIALYDDRLEIFNPGCFPGLVDINHLGDGTTFLRNPFIARIARNLSLIEKMGTGIKLMMEACKNAGLNPPEFHEDGDFVKVVFSFQPMRNRKLGDEEAILELAKIKLEIAVNEVMECLGVSRNTATRKLNQLIKNKTLTRIGKGPAVRYLLKI